MRRDRWIEPDLTRSIIEAFYEVYNALGYGSLRTPAGDY